MQFTRLNFSRRQCEKKETSLGLLFPIPTLPPPSHHSHRFLCRSLARSLALTHNLSLFRIGDSHERQPSLLSCYTVPYYVRTTSLMLLPGGAGQVFFSPQGACSN